MVYKRRAQINEQVALLEGFIKESFLKKNLKASRIPKDIKSKGYQGSQYTLECELESLAISMQLFIKILTKIFEIENVVKDNKNFLQIIALLSAYTQKKLGFMCEN